MKNKIYVLMKFPSQPDKRNLSSLFRICILLLLTGLWGTNSWAQVTLTATSGSPAGSFTTLKGAFDAINAGTHTGTIAISINANTSETAPCVLNSSGAGSASYAAISIRPTADGLTISGATLTGRGLIELNGADNVTIDGDNAGTGGINRNLTVTNTAANTVTHTSVIRIAVATTLTTSANSNTIQNCIVNGSATGRNISTATSTTGTENATYGIYAGGGASTVSQTTAPSAITSVSATVGSGASWNNLIISNNEVTSCARAIYVGGSNITVCNALTVSNNVVGSATAGNTTTVYSMGITLQGYTAATVAANTIRNIESFLATGIRGLDLGAISSAGTNAVVERNFINGVNNKSISTFGAYGINIAAGNGNTIRNNMVQGITGDMTGGAAFSTTFGIFGIRIASGINHVVYHNSVYLHGARTGTAASSLLSAAFAITGTGLTGCNVRNNIFANTQTGGTTSIAYVSMFLPSGGTSAMALTLNNNAYYCNSTAGSAGICHAGTTYTNPNTAAAGLWTAANFVPGAITPSNNLRSYTSTLSSAGTNDNLSVGSSAAAPYISTSDLHLDLSSGQLTAVEQKGDASVGIATDIDGNTRPDGITTLPDMGADEVTNLICTGAAGGTISPTTVSRCAGQTYNMSSVGADIGAGITYQWEISSTGGGVGFSNVTGGSGANTVSYTTDALTAGVYYYRLRVDCSNGPVTGFSNELTVTVNTNPIVAVDVTSANYCNPNGAAVTINASGATNYAWLPVSGLDVSTGATVIATPSGTTTYTVTGTDGNGCSATATSAITVQTGVSISSVTATPPTVCSGSNSQLQVNATSPGANTAAGTIYAAETAPLEEIPSPISVTVPTTGTIDDGFEPVNTTGSFVFNYNGINYDNFVISTNGYVVMGATAPALNGIATTLTTTVLNGFNAVIGYGRDGNINVTNGGSINHGLDASGTKYIFEYFNFSTAAGGVESATQYANFQIVLWGNASPTPGRIELIYGTSVGTPATTACLGLRDASGTTAFKNALTGSSTVASTTAAFPVDQTMYSFTRQTFSYLWSPSTFIAGQEAIANPLATGVTATTAYTVIATALNGCSASGNVTMTVEPLVCSPAIAGPINCANTNFTVTANHTGGGAPYNYSWDDGNGGVYPDAASITANLPAGSYTFTCTVLDACGSNCTSVVSVTVNGLPSVTVTPNTGLICNPGGTPVALTASGAPSFAWSPASGLSSTTGDNVTANPGGTTTYTVTGTDANGCIATATAAITVNQKANITASASPTTVCSGAPSTLTAISGTTGSVTVGTATTSIGGVNGNPYRSGNGTGNQIRTQLLYTVAELTAAGVQPGPLSSIGFTTQSSSSGTVINLSIALGSTNVTALTSTFETSSVTTVFTQASFTPLSAGLNTHVFNAGSFIWDGVSNILVNVCQTNSITGTATVSAFTPSTSSNNHKAGSVTSCTDLTGGIVANKPIVTFGWTSNTGLFTWEWQPGSLSGNSVSVNPVTTTNYTVTATSAGGCTSTSTVEVTALPNVTYYQDADNDTYGNPGVSQVSCTGAPIGYVISNTDCNDGNAAVNPAATEVCNLIDDDCDGNTDEGFDVDNDGYTSCNGDCDDNNNAVNPGASEICNGIDDNCNGLTDDNVPALPNPGAVSGTAAACLPGIAGSTSYSIAPVAGATSYVWSVPSGFVISGGQGTTSITVTWTNLAIQTGISGQLCVYAADACVSSNTSCLTIDYQVAAPVTPPSISGPGKVCPGDVVVYSIANVARATAYTWTVPGTMSIQSGQGTNVITVQVNPGYTGGTMSVIASNVCGNSAARTKTLTVNLPGTPTAIQGQKEGLCNTTGNIFSIPPVVNATSYIWNVTGGTIMGGQGTTSITVDVATLIGSGSITVQAVNGCGTSLIRTLTISGAPARAGVITGATSVCDNTNEAYSVATVPGAALYTWAVTANGSVSTGQGTKNITIDWLAPAAGQSMSVVTSNACGTSLTRTLNGITVNNCIRLGSMEANVFNISAYPNPATDRVTIEFTAVENNDYRLRIADVTGRTLMMENGTAATGLNTKVLPLNGIATGVYMISIEMNNEQQQVKLVVE